MHFICFIPIRKTRAELTLAAAELSTTHSDRALPRPTPCIPVLPVFTIPKFFRKSNTLYFICKAELTNFVLKFNDALAVGVASIKLTPVTAEIFLTTFARR